MVEGLSRWKRYCPKEKDDEMKIINVLCTLVAFLEATGIALAIPTWPSPATDELEDIMFLLSGYGRRVSMLSGHLCGSSDKLRVLRIS